MGIQPVPLSSSHANCDHETLSHGVAEYRAITKSVVVPACVLIVTFPEGGAVNENHPSSPIDPQEGVPKFQPFVCVVRPTVEAEVQEHDELTGIFGAPPPPQGVLLCENVVEAGNANKSHSKMALLRSRIIVI